MNSAGQLDAQATASLLAEAGAKAAYAMSDLVW
jgi:hypothetical protein